MSTIEAMHEAMVPARTIAERLGLTYRKVYDTLISLGLKPIRLPKRVTCRNGHDVSVAGVVSHRNGNGYPANYCKVCRREAWRRYRERQAVPQ